MTRIVPLRVPLALGGMFIVASSALLSAPLVSAAPSSDAVSTINDRYSAFGGESSLLGSAVGEAVDVLFRSTSFASSTSPSLFRS